MLSGKDCMVRFKDLHDGSSFGFGSLGGIRAWGLRVSYPRFIRSRPPNNDLMLEGS